MVNTIEDYIPYLEEEFPDLPKEVLEKIIRQGLQNMQQLIQKDHDVRFWNAHPGREYHLGLVRPTARESLRKDRAVANFKRLQVFRKKRKEKADE